MSDNDTLGIDENKFDLFNLYQCDKTTIISENINDNGKVDFVTLACTQIFNYVEILSDGDTTIDGNRVIDRFDMVDELKYMGLIVVSSRYKVNHIYLMWAMFCKYGEETAHRMLEKYARENRNLYLKFYFDYNIDVNSCKLYQSKPYVMKQSSNTLNE